jgi:hypothetical protein
MTCLEHDGSRNHVWKHFEGQVILYLDQMTSCIVACTRVCINVGTAFGKVSRTLRTQKFTALAICFITLITILISLYIFFFLCVLQTYCWLEHNLEYGIFSNQCKKLDTCLQNCCHG